MDKKHKIKINCVTTSCLLFCFSIWLFLLHPQLLPSHFYPETLLPLGSCRWTEEVLHGQRRDHLGEQRSVTALTTVWPTDQQGLSSGTQSLPDTPSPVPAIHFESASSTEVNKITWIACCVLAFSIFFTPLLSCAKHAVMEREVKAVV